MRHWSPGYWTTCEFAERHIRRVDGVSLIRWDMTGAAVSLVDMGILVLESYQSFASAP
jgi:drug/metabolite transporter superfamily protein YnfA